MTVLTGHLPLWSAASTSETSSHDESTEPARKPAEKSASLLQNASKAKKGGLRLANSEPEPPPRLESSLLDPLLAVIPDTNLMDKPKEWIGNSDYALLPPAQTRAQLNRGKLRLANFQEGPEPEQPPQLGPPTTEEQPPTLGERDVSPRVGPQDPTLERIPEAEYQRLLGSTGAPASVATGGQAVAQNVSDLGELLSQSTSAAPVEVQQRSPVALDPNVRGYRQGQIYTQAEGAFYMAARQDLDTMLNKIDPTMIDNVVVLSGPYGVQYGPGLAFISIDTADTPRYECGPEHHARILGNIRTNGGQTYGRTTAFGGDNDWGYRISYGDKKGSDYLSGNDTQIPTSYDTNDVWAQWGYSINADQRLELSYLRYEQIDTEYPGQFFNIDDLITDSVNISLTDEGPQGPWTRLAIGGWFNRTRFNGDNVGKRRPDYLEVDRAEFAVDQFRSDPDATDNFFPPPAVRETRIDAETDGDLLSTGSRLMTTFGELYDQHLNVGGDFRYIEQDINERIFVSTLVPNPIRTNLPRSWAVDPGVFAEFGTPWTSYWKVKFGGRVDFYNTKADGDFVFRGTDEDLDQDEVLYATYMTHELWITSRWTATAGFGLGERAPTLIERYSDGLFLGVAQSGFTRVRGTPTLDKETDYQVDFGVRAEYDHWRAHAAVYHAWIHDYVTLNGSVVQEPFFESARLFDYINTSWATLTGFELSGEYDFTTEISPFATMKYVDGRDREIDAPLPQIPPLDTVLGVRIHEPSPARRWSVEFAARIVDNQHRLGTVSVSRLPGAELTDVIEEATPGFTVWHLRGHYNYSRNLHLVAGVENLFGRDYQEHLDLRLRGPDNYPAPPTRALAPGITPYLGVDWTF